MASLRNGLVSKVHRRLLRRLHRYVGRPVLRYVEIHLADHCNLNCKGCGHFSPIADVGFIDLNQHSADMDRLSQLFSDIGEIRLMGGEPLLFPGISEAIAVSRRNFPHADLRIVTNGVLLTKIGESFWRACHEMGVTIDLTKYPISLDVTKIRELADRFKVSIAINECNEFFAGLNVVGDSDPHSAMKKCRSLYYCPFLQDGKLYVCSIPATVHTFNREFGTAIPSDGAIDIYDSSLTGKEIIKLLETPIPACKYCTAGDYTAYKWTVSQGNKSEWIAETNLVQISQQ